MPLDIWPGDRGGLHLTDEQLSASTVLEVSCAGAHGHITVVPPDPPTELVMAIVADAVAQVAAAAGADFDPGLLRMTWHR